VLDTFVLLRLLRCLVGGFFCGRYRLRKEPVMLVELRVGEQRYRAVQSPGAPQPARRPR